MYELLPQLVLFVIIYWSVCLQVVCEYGGELIPKQVYERRDAHYQLKGMPQKMVVLGGGEFMDGNRDSAGNVRLPMDAPGPTMNHAFLHPNCKLARVRTTKQVVMVTRMAIPKNTELTWDYNDNRTGLDPFMYV